ncbi:MAG: class I SAM-dependent methyltransferase [Roseimicrobium sp.]
MPPNDSHAQTNDKPRFTPLPTAVQWSHLIVGPRLRPGDWVVDATAGNGHDALFLAERVLPGGRVFAFDVQDQAVAQTRAKLAGCPMALATPEAVGCHLGSHDRLEELLPTEACGRLRAVMFNLGYLPGGDKAIITRLETTVLGLQAALRCLAEDGMLTVVVYPGHDGGREEAAAVEQWAASLPSGEVEVQRVGYVNFRLTTPFCLGFRKRSA